MAVKAFWVGLFALAAASAHAETNTLRIASQFGLVYLPVIVAQDQKLFEKHAAELGIPDLQVSISRVSGSTAITEAVLSGSVDAGAFGTPGLLIAWEKTKGAQHVTGIAAFASHTHFLYTNRPYVHALADFKEQDRISVPAQTSPQAILLRIAAERAGAPKDMSAKLVNMPHPESTAAVLSGAVAGHMSSPPFSQILARDSRVHAVLNSNTLLKGASAVVLGATDAFVQANPKVTQAIFAAMSEAAHLISTDPALATRIYLSSEKVKMSEDEVLALLKDGSIVYDAVPHGLMTYAQFMHQLGMLKTMPASWREVVVPALRDAPGD